MNESGRLEMPGGDLHQSELGKLLDADQARAGVAAAGQPVTAAAQTQLQHHALVTAGFSHGFLVTGVIGTLALIIALARPGVSPANAPEDPGG